MLGASKLCWGMSQDPPRVSRMHLKKMRPHWSSAIAPEPHKLGRAVLPQSLFPPFLPPPFFFPRWGVSQSSLDLFSLDLFFLSGSFHLMKTVTKDGVTS